MLQAFNCLFEDPSKFFTMKYLFPFFLLTSFTLFFPYQNKACSLHSAEAISTESSHGVSFHTASGSSESTHQNIPQDWIEHTIENVSFGLPSSWNKREMEDEHGEPTTIFFKGNSMNNAPLGIMVNVLNDYGDGLDYFRSQPNHQLRKINGNDLNILISEREISVLMPRIGSSNKALVFDFMALRGNDSSRFINILQTITIQDDQPPIHPITFSQIAEMLNFNMPKGAILNIEFSATDPCQNLKIPEANQGTPWDNSLKAEADPDEEDFELPPFSGLNDLEELSMVNYNAAVSVAFEGMKLLYGPMNEMEYRQFVNLWNPLFDYPTQEIIEYLNAMNPLISYFLGTRDAYMQLVSDFELLMLDAALAVEFDNKEAWDQIMGEASMYTNTLKDYNEILENLSRRINILGNPPNPNEQKCNDGKFYRRKLDEFRSYRREPEATIEDTKRGGFIEIGIDDINRIMVNYHALNGKGPLDYVRPDNYDPGIVYDFYQGLSIGMAEWEGFDLARMINLGCYIWTGEEAASSVIFLEEEEIVKSYELLQSSGGEKIRIYYEDDGDLADYQDAPVTIEQPTENPELEKEKREERIAFHQEMIGVIDHSLNRDIADRDRLLVELRSARNANEQEDIRRRIREYDLRIIHQQTSLQQERDLIASIQTGTLVRTRTAFDDFAMQTFINNIRENSARVMQAQRIANGIERQIELLPGEMRPAMRESAYRILDGKVAQGDVETARRLATSLNNQIQGMAEYDIGRAEEAEVNANQNEFYAQMTIMAASSITVGLGSQAITHTFGVHSAASVYGSKVLGGVYGGTTGYLAGGPQQGVRNAISGISSYGNVAMMFMDGYQNPALQEDADISTLIFEGVKAAGTGFLMAKAFEFGARKLTSTAMIAFGKDSRLFQPVIPSPERTSIALRKIRQGADDLRTINQQADAENIIRTYESLDDQLTRLRTNPSANATRITTLEREMDQLTASINASYEAKWMLKYDRSASKAARAFDNRLQKNYNTMIPGMKRRLAERGYVVDDVDFRQFRNHNSAGTASMDLDLGPVSAQTGLEPNSFRKQDGTMVSVEDFMQDAQAAMDVEWFEMFGISSRASEMNVVTSAHREAFASTRMLDKNLNFADLTVDELRSVGRVLQVKTDGIDRNRMLTSTQKIQAKSREASKEVGNFINRKLRQDLSRTSSGTPEYEQLMADITYWEDMEGYLTQFGTTNLNPMEMRNLNIEMMKKTGGNGISDVINDVITYY